MIENFRQAMRATGIETKENLLADGALHRFHVDGDKAGTKNGWYILHGDEMPAGQFGSYRLDISETWTRKESRVFTPEEKVLFAAKMKAAQQQRDEMQAKVQAECRAWCKANFTPAKGASDDHPYLQIKGVRSHGLKILGESLLIPIRDMNGTIHGLQFISPNGQKKFKPGTAKQGHYFSIGRPKENTLLACEGYATGASLHEATGHAVAVCFDAGNLKPVAEVLRKKYPEYRLIVCADNDQSGVGQEKAESAAAAVGGVVVIPPDVGDDFNDLHQKTGSVAVKAVIEAAVVGAYPEHFKISVRQAPATVATVTVAEWPKPLSLIVCQQADPYPLDALPETIGAAVREVVDFVQCPVALAACSALAVVSIVGQGHADVRRASKLYGPASLYLLAIAESGERKSTVDGHFKQPVEEWEAEQAEAAKPEIKRYLAESQAWEAKKSGLLTAIKEATKKGTDTKNLEKEFTTLEMAKPMPPKVPRLLFSDATPEALAHQLAFGWPVGGVLSSEAGIVFGGHAMSKESAMRNMSMLNSLWGAEPLTIDRRSSSSYTVRGARLTMGLAVQSGTVREFLDTSKGLARSIGWLARFLIAWPESTQGSRMYQEPPEHWPHLAKFHRRLGAFLDLPLPIDEKGELSPTVLELSSEAKAAWVAFHDEVEEELRPGRDMADAKDVASKAADNAARLAALFHLFENGTDGTIGQDHMQAAASLVTWHLYEARRFMGEIALPVEINNALRLNDWLLEYCRVNRVEEVPTRDIQRTGPNCVREKRALDLTLEELADAGRVRIAKDGKRKLVKVNPQLLGGGSHGIA